MPRAKRKEAAVVTVPAEEQDQSLAEYEAFLKAKTAIAPRYGFEIEPDEIHHVLKPHQRDIVRWMVSGGRRACFASFGLGKSVVQLEAVRLTLSRCGGRGLIVCPLGVRAEFIRDAKMIGMDVSFIRRIEEADETGIYLTNYETIRDGKMDPRQFMVASLDEAACLRGFGGTKTFREFMRLFTGDEGPKFAASGRTRAMTHSVPYRFLATATPSPNEYIELLAYSAYLDVMDVSAAKTRFFKRDSTQADRLTLHEHKKREFWLWVATWAIFIQRPSDLGYSDEGYALPPLDVRWHEVRTDHSTAVSEKDGQGRMFKNVALGVVESSREKRESRGIRTEKMLEIVNEEPDEHFILWHDLEAERHAIKEALPTAHEVYGTQDLEAREKIIADFSSGKIQYLATKPVLAGSGCNLQRYCHRAIFVGIGFKFNDLIQACHRIQRFLQTEAVRIDLIYTEAERAIRKILERKWAQHEEVVGQMTAIIREFGLAHAELAQQAIRAMGVERVEVVGANHRLVNEDCVREVKRLESNSVGLILTSIPFCYDSGTEVLTRRGWLSFGDVVADDDVATVNPKGLHFEWQHPSRLVWERYDGKMLRFGNRSFDLVVTPNHRMFAARRGKSFGPSQLSLVEASAIASDYEGGNGRLLRGWRTCLIPPNRGDGARPDRINIPKLPAEIRAGHGVELYWIDAREFMALAGWYLSEGHADPFESGRQAGRLSIAQVKDEGLRMEIHDLFLRIGLPPSMHSRQITVWCRNLAYFLIQEFGHGSKQKRIPAWVREMHPDLLVILRDTMMKGDGAKNGTGYTSYSRELRDGFQEICLKTGWRACINGMQVHVGTKQVYPEIRQAPEAIEYSGMIGCATVPNGLLIVRRNGKPCVSGNSSQYEYSPNFADFGHSDNNDHFWQQMGFLIPELLRVLSPGRIAAIHVKDRIVPSGMTGLGCQTVYPLHMKCTEHFVNHGFAYLGMKTIVTDVVRENNQTYRLGWTEQCKDGTKMGVGMPEYLMLFRKPPTDTANCYADIPVVKSKARYTRSRWQIDAHGFSRASGDRPITAEDLEGISHQRIFRAFRKFSLETVYDYEHHVKLGEALEAKGRLPVTFMLLQPPSYHPDVWTDIARMLTLNTSQSLAGKEMHLCPLQLQLADRAIEQLSAPGDLVLDPFAGLGTVPMRAIKLGRRGLGIELSKAYFVDAVAYCASMEREVTMPTLFDFTEAPEEEESVPVEADGPGAD